MMGAALGVYMEFGPGNTETQRYLGDEHDKVITDLSSAVARAADEAIGGRSGAHAGADRKGQGELVARAAWAA